MRLHRERRLTCGERRGTIATVAVVFNVGTATQTSRESDNNRALLRAATELAPSPLNIGVCKLDGSAV